MKKQGLKWIFSVLLLTCGLWVWAAEETQNTEEQKSKPAPMRAPRVRQPVIPNAAGQPDARARGRMVSEEMSHQELIKELLDIKKIADEEGATKTSEAIQKMIEKRNEEYQKNMAEMLKRREQIQKQIEERMKARQQRAGRTPGRNVTEEKSASPSAEPAPAAPKTENK